MKPDPPGVLVETKDDPEAVLWSTKPGHNIKHTFQFNLNKPSLTPLLNTRPIHHLIA